MDRCGLTLNRSLRAKIDDEGDYRYSTRSSRKSPSGLELPEEPGQFTRTRRDL